MMVLIPFRAGTRVISEARLSRYRPWILYLAFVLFGIACYLWFPSQFDWGDSYDLMAKGILEGHGFAEPRTPIKPGIPDYRLGRFWERNDLAGGVARFEQPTALWDPAYPHWLAFWFFILGYRNPWVAVVQILFMGITLPIVYYLGKYLVNAKAGFVAGIILLFHPQLFRFTTQYPSENLFIPLLIGGLGAWYWCKNSPSISKAIIFSILWAVAGLARMVGIYLAIFALIALFLSTPKFRKYIFVCLGIFVVLWGGWAYRNSVVMGKWKLLPTKVGFNLWWENNRRYLTELTYNRTKEREVIYFGAPENVPVLEQLGFSKAEIENLKRYDYPAEIVDSTEVVREKALNQKFKLFFKEHPKIVIAYYLEHLYVCFAESLGGPTHNREYVWTIPYFIILFALAFVGIIVAFKNFRKYWFLISYILLYILTLGSVPGFRFRLPLDPILAIYAGMAVLFIYDVITRKSSTKNLDDAVKLTS
jgi:4-amino-4-deoxy-L-arabinose transferase-like glycosyltransferase